MSEKHFGPIWFIPGENKGRYPYCHSIYLPDLKVIIDPASNRGRLKELRENPGVKEVWLSHWHEDHFMHLDLFDDLPLATSKEDATPLSDLETLLDAYGANENLKKIWRPLYQSLFNFKPRRPEKFLRNNEIIQEGETSVEIIHTPGHTPGHLAFLFKEQQVLFLGDYDLSPFGPWYGDVESDIEKTIESINKLKEIPAKIWLAAHEKGVFEEQPGSLWSEYLEVINQRDQKLLSLLAKAGTIVDIVKACLVYGRPREPKYFFEFGERALMQKHLERLISQGKIIKEQDKYRTVTLSKD